MFWSSSSPEEPEVPRPGLPDQLSAALASALGYLRARLELAGIEGREAAVIYGKIFAFLAGALLLLLFGYIFLWIGLTALIAHYSSIHWGWVTLGVGVLHLLGVTGCLVAIRSQWGRPVFPETLNEFRKDQEWLSQKSTQNGKLV